LYYEDYKTIELGKNKIRTHIVHLAIFIITKIAICVHRNNNVILVLKIVKRNKKEVSCY